MYPIPGLQIVQIVPTVTADFPKMQERKEGAEFVLTAKLDGSPPPKVIHRPGH